MFFWLVSNSWRRLDLIKSVFFSNLNIPAGPNNSKTGPFLAYIPSKQKNHQKLSKTHDTFQDLRYYKISVFAILQKTIWIFCLNRRCASSGLMPNLGCGDHISTRKINDKKSTRFSYIILPWESVMGFLCFPENTSWPLVASRRAAKICEIWCFLVANQRTKEERGNLWCFRNARPENPPFKGWAPKPRFLEVFPQTVYNERRNQQFHLVLNSICNERRNQRNQRNQPNRQRCISEVREEYQVTCFKSYVWSDIDCCRFWHLLAASKEESTLKLQNLWLSFVERYQDGASC